MDPKIIKLGARPFYQPKGRIFAIGDVHGEAVKLLRLLEKIKLDLKPEDHIVFVGDLVDVGPKTLETLKIVQQLINEHPNTFVIMGNHEEMFLMAMNKDDMPWLVNGGGITDEFRQQGVFNANQIDGWLIGEEITFLKDLIPYYETEQVLITHAPFGDRTAHAWAIEEGLLEKLDRSIRWRFVDHEKRKVEKIENKLFVCGHQNGFGRVKAPRFYPDHNRIYVDAGAGYHKTAPVACAIVYPFDQIKPILSD